MKGESTCRPTPPNGTESVIDPWRGRLPVGLLLPMVQSVIDPWRERVPVGLLLPMVQSVIDPWRGRVPVGLLLPMVQSLWLIHEGREYLWAYSSQWYRVCDWSMKGESTCRPTPNGTESVIDPWRERVPVGLLLPMVQRLWLIHEGGEHL